MNDFATASFDEVIDYVENSGYDHELNSDQTEEKFSNGMFASKTVDPGTGLPTSAGLGSWLRVDLDSDTATRDNVSRVRIQNLGLTERGFTQPQGIDMNFSADELEMIGETFVAMALCKRIKGDQS